MELADGGDLKQLIDKRNGLLMQENEILYIFYQLLLAVQILHLNLVIHSNIKPENILLYKDCIKLGDLGNAAVTG